MLIGIQARHGQQNALPTCALSGNEGSQSICSQGMLKKYTLKVTILRLWDSFSGKFDIQNIVIMQPNESADENYTADLTSTHV